MKNLFLLLLLVPGIAFGFSKAGTVYTTDGSRLDIVNAIADADPYDTIRIPTNTVGSAYIWGTGGTHINVNKEGLTLTGDGMNDTFVVAASDSPTGHDSPLIRIGASNVVIKNFQITNLRNGGHLFGPGTSANISGWRITGIKAILYNGSFYRTNYGQGGSSAYVYGSIDENDITGGDGQNELIYTRGLFTAWDDDAPLGTNQTLFIEDNDFRGQGYICDINANGVATIRKNRAWNDMKADGHGGSTNYPKMSCRLLEIYDNDWYVAGTSIEVRGGKTMIFNNRGVSGSTMYTTDYAIISAYYGGVTSHPGNLPLPYAIGAGKRVTINATEMVAGVYYQVKTVGTSDFDLIDQGEYVDILGSTNTSNNPNTVGAQFVATGPTPGTGTVTYTPANDPSYVFNNLRAGAAWPRLMKAVGAGGIAAYGSSYTENDMITDDLHVFSSSGWYGTTFTFNGSRGVGRGPKSDITMPSGIVGTKAGVGFWVTDEADWDSTSPGNDGQLYIWDGDSWELAYTPAPYPNYLRVEAPIAGTPATPTVLVAPDNGIYVCDLTWVDNADNEDSFEVQMSTTGAGVGFTTIASVAPADGTGSTVTFKAAGIPAGATRYFRVRAVNAINASAWTSEDTAKTLTFGHVPLNRNPRAIRARIR